MNVEKYIRIFLLSLLLIFLSCSTVSPLGPSVSFQDIEAVQPSWQKFADGIGYFHGKIIDPQIEFWALQIELGTGKSKIVVKEENLSTRVSSFVRSNNLIAGINTAPFDVITSREGQPIKNIGIVVSNGVLITPANPAYDALVFYKNGRAAIVRQSSLQSNQSIENIENAAGGFHQILTSGEPAQRTLGSEGAPSQRHPRSAAGISANGDILFLLVIDGRRAASIGSTELETALLLRTFGCHDGINFDGGGSTALALRYPDGNVRTVNTPIHGGFPGHERAVAGILGISLRN